MKIATLLLALLVAHAAAADVDIAKELRAGGYVMYMRHTSTDFSQNDSRMKSFEDCGNQRNLTDKGRAEARAVAEQVKRLRIPIGEVLASPFCRTMETARLAFGKAKPMVEIRGGPLRGDDPKRYDPLRKLLSEPVPKGENRVIASHGNPYNAIFGAPFLAEGEVSVIRPEGAGKFSVIGRIRLDEWQFLD
jgi:hypothetical protein